MAIAFPNFTHSEHSCAVADLKITTVQQTQSVNKPEYCGSWLTHSPFIYPVSNMTTHYAKARAFKEVNSSSTAKSQQDSLCVILCPRMIEAPAFSECLSISLYFVSISFNLCRHFVPPIISSCPINMIVRKGGTTNFLWACFCLNQNPLFPAKCHEEGALAIILLKNSTAIWQVLLTLPELFSVTRIWSSSPMHFS